MEAHISRQDRQPRRSVTVLLDHLAQAVQSLPRDRQALLQDILTMPAAERLSEALRRSIRDSGSTHFAIGKLAGVATSQIDRFVSGERDLTLATADRLAAALGLELAPVARKVEPAARKPPTR